MLDVEIIQGRRISRVEIAEIQALIEANPLWSRWRLSRVLAQRWQWYAASGVLKDMAARTLLLKLHERELIALPERRRAPVVRGSPLSPEPFDSVVPEPVVADLSSLRPLQICVVGPQQPDYPRFQRYLSQHHYLGYRGPVGANLRYLVRCARCPEQVLACLLWTSPAWRMAVRDRWIGWSDSERRRNLQLIVSNARFLILPWVRVPGLASKILSRCSRQLPADWEEHYGYRPLLLETLVDGRRFRGTCYQAANWVLLGQTAGRGRMDRENVARGRAVKDVYVYPLCRQVQQRLRTAAAPRFCGSAAGEGG